MVRHAGVSAEEGGRHGEARQPSQGGSAGPGGGGRRSLGHSLSPARLLRGARGAPLPGRRSAPSAPPHGEMPYVAALVPMTAGPAQLSHAVVAFSRRPAGAAASRARAKRGNPTTW
jgi:hypothetical protein